MALDQATFVVSLDTELAWGSVDRPRPDARQPQYERTREVITRLLAMFERYEVHGTWAIVGHLFLESCGDDGHSLKHDEIVRPKYQWLNQDWFANDPGTNHASDPTWYAPDVVREIQECRVEQEIGSHGFSHMIIGDQGCSRETFVSELEAFDKAADTLGVKARSFVFPRNAIGHLDVLAERGYLSYRGESPAWFTRFPGKAQRLARLVDGFSPFLGATASPEWSDSGLWDVPATYLYLHRSGWGRFVPISFRVRKAIGALRRAARNQEMFHLWFHPFNLASDPESLLDGLQQILEEFRSLRDSGLMSSMTMSGLAASLNSSKDAGVTAAYR